MTRINVVPPSELSRQHLIAEYRELPRVFTLVERAIARGEQPHDPRNPRVYTLGRGHVRFFYNKLDYLYNRQAAICREMRFRGFHTNFQHLTLGERIPRGVGWWNVWLPTPEALAINRQRILERTPDAHRSS